MWLLAKEIFKNIVIHASSETMNILWEKNHAWTNNVNKVRTYPQDLFDQFTPDGDCHYIVKFPFIDRDYYYDMLLSLGDKCECLAPTNIREKLSKKISCLAELYKD